MNYATALTAAYADTMRAALAATPAAACYQRDLIRGYRAWSGADLAGKARRYGGRYASSRASAARRWEQAGGDFVRLRRGGRIVAAVEVAPDIYATRTGILTRADLR